mmetsp:Transcript_2881/g.3061  ORF Transcript_2881/g.3061 Transcript_2881/m.3061 type:complete len:304 (-) Transcript_2881:1698-2609(-)
MRINRKSPSSAGKLETEFQPYFHNERLTYSSIAGVSLWADAKNIPIFLGDQPELIYRQNVANNYTLMQLQQIFMHCNRLLGQNPDLEPHVPANAGYFSYPELFLTPSDTYMSAVLDALTMTGKFKNIVCIVGLGQQETLPHYLRNRTEKSLMKELEPKVLKNSLIRGDDTCEVLVDKHTLLDILFHGKGVFDEEAFSKSSLVALFNDFDEYLEALDFHSTSHVIQKYADPENTDSKRIPLMRNLQYQLLDKYAESARRDYQVGEQQLQHKFLLNHKQKIKQAHMGDFSAPSIKKKAVDDLSYD